MVTRSLSVVLGASPRMYKFVLLSWSPLLKFELIWLLKLVLCVPLCEPVFELDELWVLAGEVAVGTRLEPYCNKHTNGSHTATRHATPSHAAPSFFLRAAIFFPASGHLGVASPATQLPQQSQPQRQTVADPQTDSYDQIAIPNYAARGRTAAIISHLFEFEPSNRLRLTGQSTHFN